MNALFSGGRDVAEIDGEYHPYVEKAVNSHKSSLKHQHRSFITKGNNSRLLVTPLLLTVGFGGRAMFIFS